MDPLLLAMIADGLILPSEEELTQMRIESRPQVDHLVFVEPDEAC